MINNEFNLIGICTSNFQNISNNKWKSYVLKLEIEKFGSHSGNTFEIEVQIYGANTAIKTDVEMLGHQVAVNGYIDNYVTNEGRIITKLIAQRIYILGKQKMKVSPKATLPDETPIPEEQPDDQPLPDDDLPW